MLREYLPASILVGRLKLAAQGREGFGGNGVAVDGRDHVWAGLVDCGVDGKARWVLRCISVLVNNRTIIDNIR